jgi:hypothetical protein
VSNTKRDSLIHLQGRILTATANKDDKLQIKALVKLLADVRSPSALPTLHASPEGQDIATLPANNLAVLSFVINFLHQLLEHTSFTKMTSHNLALIFSQIIFRLVWSLGLNSRASSDLAV